MIWGDALLQDTAIEGNQGKKSTNNTPEIFVIITSKSSMISKKAVKKSNLFFQEVYVKLGKS